MFVTVKTCVCVSEFYDGAYSEVTQHDDKIEAKGTITVPSGSPFSFTDLYEVAGSGFKVSRNVKVLKVGDDLGFSTKISLVMAESDNTRDYHCFAPGVWYKQNEFAPDSAIGKDLDCEYFWRRRQLTAFPCSRCKTSRQGKRSLCRDGLRMSRCRRPISESRELRGSRSCTVGAIGMSKPERQTLNYKYYGFAIRKQIETEVDGLSIDYVYPASDGQLPRMRRYPGLDYKEESKSFQRTNHPMEVGFEQNYAVALNLGQYEDFQPMMRTIWRVTYDRLRDKLFDVDNEKHFHNCMKILTRYTRQYGDSYGLPFACQLPDMDISVVSFQFGFVGQQPGIGYQLLRYGDKEKVPEAYEKGVKIIDFWVRTAMTESGLP